MEHSSNHRVPHIGQEIHNHIKRTGRTVSWFAREIGYDRSNCYRIFQQQSIDTLLLLRISRVLNRNFFELYSLCLD